MNRILILICASFLISCSGKDRVPKTVIQPEKMQEVLWDVLLSEAWARQSTIADSTLVLSDEVKRRAGEALKFHNIPEKKFFDSYDWYLKHPQIFHAMLDSLHNFQTRRELEPVELLDDGIEDERPSQPRLDRTRAMDQINEE